MIFFRQPLNSFFKGVVTTPVCSVESKVTMAELIWHPQEREKIATSAFNERLREPRIGCLVHFDASATDAGAMSWFAHPDCLVAYHYLALDDGSYVNIAPHDSRAWHAGRCRPSDDRLQYVDGNSAFMGIAAATNQHESATYLQALTIAWLTWREFIRRAWSLDETWRIVGHSTEGWERGRKIDPEGLDPKRPILSVAGIRSLVPLFRSTQMYSPI